MPTKDTTLGEVKNGILTFESYELVQSTRLSTGDWAGDLIHGTDALQPPLKFGNSIHQPEGRSATIQ